MKKSLTLALSLLTFVSTSYAGSVLTSALDILENDYELKCSLLSDSSYHCHLKDDKFHGIDVEVKEKKKKTVLKISEFNNSENDLYRHVFAKKMDHRFFGERLVSGIIESVRDSDSDLSCNKLHENLVGKRQQMIYNPGFKVIMKAECFNSSGKAHQITADLGSINRSHGFLQSITITNEQK